MCEFYLRYRKTPELENTNPFYCYVFIKRGLSELFIDSPSFYLFQLDVLFRRHFTNIAALKLKVLLS